MGSFHRSIIAAGFIFISSVSAFAADELQIATDPYLAVFQAVSSDHLQKLLKEMTGVAPVVVGSDHYSITDRYLPDSKKKFRAYWKQYFQSLGASVTELAYPTAHRIGEAEGHNMEAILTGRSPDSIVIIVHYDSIGPWGHENENPGVDDDMTGMSIELETARILSQYRGQLEHTVRFVAADYEEHSSPGLEGARNYVTYLKSLAAKENFKIIAAIDNEQSGWNCAKEGLCSSDVGGKTFDVFSCSDEKEFSPELGDALTKVSQQYSSLRVNRGCIGENSDHYAFWEAGFPAIVFSEHDPFNNPHFDQNGGDTYEKIDQDYFFKIAQVGVTFAAKMVGITPPSSLSEPSNPPKAF